MDVQTFSTKSVKELQGYLKERGVIFSDQKKINLIELCTNAHNLGLEIDPDGLLEDRGEILNTKLLTSSGKTLENPEKVEGSQNLSILPPFSIFDIYNYLITFDEYDHATLRHFNKMEAFGMFEDGYVLAVESCRLDTNYVALKSKVKPRTNEKDPVTKLKYYKTWIIFSSTQEASNTGTIHSALCTCRGGVDGACRHVVATLFEVMDYLNDRNKSSVTSGPCMWVKRNSKSAEPVLITELDTSITMPSSHPKPSEDMFNPTPSNQSLPYRGDFIMKLKEISPKSCLLDAWEERIFEDVSAPLNLKLPTEKTRLFWTGHILHRCSSNCFSEFLEYLAYSHEDLTHIESGTCGQSENKNWKLAREGILTSSNFKTICHSTDQKKTCQKLFKSPFSSNNIPEPVLFGRKFENKAREMFLKSHRFHHRKCKLKKCGLFISPTDPFLGASPDGIIDCSICGKFLIEVKCMYTYRNFHPKAALVASKICQRDGNDLKMVYFHQYHYQIQGQMAVTGIQKCVLVGFTKKGIHTIDVQFDEDMWHGISKTLRDFYNKHFLPTLLSNGGIPVDYLDA